MIYCNYNGTDLSTLTNVLLDDVDGDDTAKRLLSSFKLARADNRVITNAQYDGKDIIVTGQIVATDRATMLANRNSLIAAVSSGVNKTLLVNINDTIQKFVATAEAPMITETKGGFAKFSIKFVCRDAYGVDQNLQFLLNVTGQTTTPNTQNLSTIGGNYDIEPIIEVYITAVSGGSSKYIQLTNVATSKAMRITNNWAVGQLLVINPEDRTVKVNNVEIDFLGDFLTFAVGSGQQIKYEDNFTTSRTVQIRVKYRKRYL